MRHQIGYEINQEAGLMGDAQMRPNMVDEMVILRITSEGRRPFSGRFSPKAALSGKCSTVFRGNPTIKQDGNNAPVGRTDDG